MSPLVVRRYRAERLLREDFERLRTRVLAGVSGRLRTRGVDLDHGDLEACYAQAWQGLYSALLNGQEIANPTGWLVLVTFRRAIEEQRAQRRARGGVLAGAAAGDRGEDALASAGAIERDLAGELDDRLALRALMEGMRFELDAREREAAALCYLQGLPRRQAAARMGLSDARMRKLMDGRHPGRPGVAAKVGALAERIRDGRWCAEQGSLMRALAFGMLDPNGERYRIATLHRRECPACRAYVASLRRVAAALPPVLAPLRLGASGVGGAAGGAGSHLAAGGSHAAGGAAGLGGAPATSPTVALTLSGASGAGAGAGGAGAGGLLAGPLGAKLAVGCLLALGIGAGCAQLGAAGGTRPRAPLQARSASLPARTTAPAGAVGGRAGTGVPAALGPPARLLAGIRPRARFAPAPARAAREFSPEQQQPLRGAPGRGAPGSVGALTASLAREPSGGGRVAGGAAAAAARPDVSSPGPGAEREFSP